MKKLALALFLFVAAVPSRAEDLAAEIARIEAANHPKELEKAREHARKVGVDVALLR